MPTKVVVIGSVNGRFREVFQKVSTLHSKNKFDFAIVAGDLFSDTAIETNEDSEQALKDLLEGRIDVPLTTYFSLGNHGLPGRTLKRLEENDVGELCSNLFFLGKRSTMKTSEGVRIVTLGGRLDANLNVASSKDKTLPFYSVGDAKTLHGANTADILLTSEWPSGIQTGSKVDLPSPNPPAHECISDLCAVLKPRYFFSTSGDSFYEREPFFYAPSPDGVANGTEEAGYPSTRFISLASYGNAAKAKWIYAFTLDTTTPPPATVPAGTTASPFNFISKKRPQPSEDNGSSYQRWSNDHHSHHRPNKRHRRDKQPPPGPENCFFCLSNPNTAMHLITSVGNEAYITTAKGPLPTPETFPSLGGTPGHVLIIPLAHAPTLSAIPDPASRTATTAEMRRYRSEIHGMLDAKSAGELGAVTWEVSRAGGIHTHWQVCPVPATAVRKGLVEAAFKVEAENEQYPSFQASSAADNEQDDEEMEAGDCFKVWMWSPAAKSGDETIAAEKDKKMLLPLDASFRFDMQFGRRVVAKLLGLDSRVDWRACGQSEQEETREADVFKAAFKEFDFTLDY